MVNNSANIIEVNGLSRKFGDFEAVKSVSFDVSRGEIFGFLGPNGAGKTTTISMLCTLLKPSSGAATVNDFDIISQQDQVRESIGLVFQESSLDDRLTAKENLIFHGVIYGLDKKLARERIDEVLGMVELTDRQDQMVRSFSGGMKRRLELARGLMHYPKVLFLDEPTLGLDPQSRQHLWTYILKLRERENITIFMTTHYMDEADNCDRIAIIDHGKIVALDSPSGLKAQVGADIVSLKTADDQAALELLQQQDLEPKIENGSILFKVAGGDKFIVNFIRDFTIPITSITVRQPTLDDVFLNFTGRELRDQEASASEINARNPWVRAGRRS